MDSLLMEARKERERLEEENERVTRARGSSEAEKKTYPILSGVPGEDPEAVKELIVFMDKVGNKSNEVIDNIVIPHIQKTNKSFKEGLDYIGNKIAESGKPLVEAIKDLEERFAKAEGGDVDEQMSMLMGPTHTMPDGTVMPGATHEEGEMMMQEVPLSSLRAASTYWRFYMLSTED